MTVWILHEDDDSILDTLVIGVYGTEKAAKYAEEQRIAWHMEHFGTMFGVRHRIESYPVIVEEGA